jgi:antitoxin ParD1/3/4
MRTNIDIDDSLMSKAMSAGPFKTKKDAVEAGLKLLARQAAYREVLKWEGKLHWEGEESADWTQALAEGTAQAAAVQARPAPAYASDARPLAEATKTTKATKGAKGAKGAKVDKQGAQRGRR